MVNLPFGISNLNDNPVADADFITALGRMVPGGRGDIERGGRPILRAYSFLPDSSTGDSSLWISGVLKLKKYHLTLNYNHSCQAVVHSFSYS